MTAGEGLELLRDLYRRVGESQIPETEWIYRDLHTVIAKLAQLDAPGSTCDHAESLHGRCVACGMTWEQQAAERQLTGHHRLRALAEIAKEAAPQVRLGSYVRTSRHGYTGRVYEIHDHCPESAEWIRGQEIPLEGEYAEGLGTWYSILVHDGGAVVVPADSVELIDPIEGFDNRGHFAAVVVDLAEIAGPAPTVIDVDDVPLSSCCHAELTVEREVGPDTSVFHAKELVPAEGEMPPSLRVSFVKTYDAVDSGAFEVNCGNCGRPLDTSNIDIEES